jgi:hypothetical protein
LTKFNGSANSPSVAVLNSDSSICFDLLAQVGFSFSDDAVAEWTKSQQGVFVSRYPARVHLRLLVGPLVHGVYPSTSRFANKPVVCQVIFMCVPSRALAKPFGTLGMTEPRLFLGPRFSTRSLGSPVIHNRCINVGPRRAFK